MMVELLPLGLGRQHVPSTSTGLLFWAFARGDILLPPGERIALPLSSLLLRRLPYPRVYRRREARGTDLK